MDQISVPTKLRDPEETPYLVEGPFKVTFNGVRGVGLWLVDNGDSYSFAAFDRGFRIDDTYTAHTTVDTITFYSEQLGRKFVIQPLAQSDVEWLVPDEPEADINDLKEIILDGYRHELDDNLGPAASTGS